MLLRRHHVLPARHRGAQRLRRQRLLAGRALGRSPARRTSRRPALGAGPRRRTPGLRRSELATLAGVSVEYVTRLEQ
ncbi:hypothetical protein AB0957_36385, partial [Streptomyces zhihengii]